MTAVLHDKTPINETSLIDEEYDEVKVRVEVSLDQRTIKVIEYDSLGLSNCVHEGFFDRLDLTGM